MKGTNSKPPKAPRNRSTDDNDDLREAVSAPVVALLCFRGAEVIVAASPDASTVLTICARTRQVFGTLPISSRSTVKILHVNNFTGLIVVVTKSNEIFMFRPIKSESTKAFGRFEWVPHSVTSKSWINVTEYIPSNDSIISSVASSANWRLLVTIDKNICVFDVLPRNKSLETALYWSMQLQASIMQADISGDGNAIAFFFESFGDPAVYTFRKGFGTNGNLYDCDDILPHPYPLTNISFRGRGFLWNDDGFFTTDLHLDSCIPTGNDLLLTMCGKQSVTHIFSQRKWKECVNWETAENCRTVWVHGLAIANLGDLDVIYSDGASRKPTSSVANTESFAHSKRQNVTGKHLSDIQALPGAWLAELSVQGHYPALRLSSLIFGEDGSANPELVEGASTVLPGGSLSTSLMINEGNHSLCIQGVWSSCYNEVFSNDEANLTAFVPPAELRLLATQREDVFSLLDIPLCMDEGLPDTAEFRSPQLHVLSIRPMYMPPRVPRRKLDPKPTCMDYMSSKLCAELCNNAADGRVIAITWIDEGASFVSPENANETIAQNNFSSCPFLIDAYELSTKQISEMKHDAKKLVDVSTFPLPIILPSLRIGSRGDETIASLHWWPNENFGGDPRLLVLTTSGTVSLYEIPPCWKALEPSLPIFDPLSLSKHSFNDARSVASMGYDDDDDDELTYISADREYEVSLTPHPDFGIGLRLEAQDDGLPAVVGSYKKHPLSGGRLPAEKNGMIMVGDELIAVNDESLLNINFDEIISAVRRIGSNTNAPLRMKFRSTAKRIDNIDISSQASNIPRRNLSDMLGIKKKMKKQSTDEMSVATGVMMFESNDVKPKDWVKTLSKTRGAFSDISPISCSVVLPMNYGKGAPSKDSGVKAVLIIAVGGLKMMAARLELDEITQECKFKIIGQTNIETDSSCVNTITPVKTATAGWCVAVVDECGKTMLVFVDTEIEDTEICATFRQYHVFEEKSSGHASKLLIIAASVNLIATTGWGNRNEVHVWYSMPRANPDGKETYHYQKTNIIAHCDENILDIKWIQSGFLDSYPWLVLFYETRLFVFYRPGGSFDWLCIAELSYPIPEDTKFDGSISPADAFPHIISSLRNIININDERLTLKSDWNIDALVAYICTDEDGVCHGLKGSAERIFAWLSQWHDSDVSSHPIFAHHCALSVIPWMKLTDPTTLKGTGNSVQGSKIDRQNQLMSELQRSLSLKRETLKENKMLSAQDEDFIIPQPLHDICGEEVSALWALGEIISRPPDFSKLDLPGELFLFSATMFRLLRSDSVVTNKCDNYIASSAVFSALLSESQNEILCSIRDSGFKMMWKDVKSLMVPLWLRDDEQLKKVTEDVAKMTFQSTKKSMDCMLFYVVLNKKQTLINFAKADKSLEGEKLVKFLTNYDFSTPRGRKAAEKNAFSLLRKRRYIQAASFFLLTEPPMLTSALNVIIMQMNDLSLALLVIRMMDNANVKNNNNGLTNMTNFGSSFGLGSNAPLEKFEKWNSSLGEASCKILRNQGCEMVSKDRFLEGVLMLWLQKRTDAVYRITVTEYENPGAFLEGRKLDISRINDLIDFSSETFLLRWMKADLRLRWSTALRLSRALSRRGIELAAMQTLLQDTVSEQCHEKEHLSNKAEVISHLNKVSNNPSFDDKPKQHQSHGMQTSSIFDSFDTAPPQKPKDGQLSTAKEKSTQSSIFDAYDISPSTKSKPIHQSQAIDGMQSSSIFDSFATVPPPKPKDERTSNMVLESTQSSIFDAYDANPPSKAKSMKQSQVVHGMQSSSIFDSFDVATPPKPKVQKASAVAVESTQSSIFDAYNVNPPSKAKPTNQSQIVDGMQSTSIFDSFDVAPQENPKVDQQSTAAVESTQSSIFDAYNVGPPSKAISKDEKDVPPNIQLTSMKLDNMHISPQNHINSSVPPLWNEYKETLLADTVARRVLREIGFVVSRMKGELPVTPLHKWASPDHHSIRHDAAQLLQHGCEGNMLGSIESCLRIICEKYKIEADAVLEKALLLIGCPTSTKRTVFAVLLYRLMNRMDLAEVTIRNTARIQIRMCSGFSLGNDGHFTHHGQFSVSSLLARRHAACLSWQLELCLWLQRGNVLPLTPCTESEATIAVRMGLVLAGWGRSFYDLEQLSKCEPDCPMNLNLALEMGRTMKCISFPNDTAITGVHSGGWEFLVDCSRYEAVDILKTRKRGSFLLRPHSEDSSVFTLSFRSDVDDEEKDCVQHAIVRLSDQGFRCGSFGPFPTLIKLLNAVSDSLPYGLRLDEPPVQALIKNEGRQPSPNSVLIRKLTMHARPEKFEWGENKVKVVEYGHDEYSRAESSLVERCYGIFASLLILSTISKHLCAVVCGDIKGSIAHGFKEVNGSDEEDDYMFADCESFANSVFQEDEIFANAIRTLRPLMEWRRSLEMLLLPMIAPTTPEQLQPFEDINDAIVRWLIKPGSGVDVRTLRIGEGSHSAVVVLFSESDAVSWLLSTKKASDEDDALSLLEEMSKKRVIEPFDLKELAALSTGKSQTGVRDIRYRFVDPWEIESFEVSNRIDSQGAKLGRSSYSRLSMTKVSRITENVMKSIGGMPLMSAWNSLEGADALNNMISNVLPPWERNCNGDCERTYDSKSDIPRSIYIDSVRRYLYRNHIFRRLKLPQRFIAIIQVDLLDLKNLTSPGGSPSLTAYALLRLKRSGKSSPLTHRIRTLDSAATEPAKIDRSSGPNPSASWKSITRFRFALPEEVDSFGICPNRNREALFPGPPSMLQLSVYEKKFITDTRLGSADVKLDGLADNCSIEEWVPLRAGKDGIVWFARMRISLKFKLHCLSESEEQPSVGLERIKKLSQHGAYEDLQEHTSLSNNTKRSVSTPDMIGHLVQ